MEDGEVLQYKLINTCSFRTCSSNRINSGCRNELRLILLGKTGTGLSSLGNLILRRRAFTSKLSCRSVTQTLNSQSAILHGTQIIAVDTPGLFNTEIVMADNVVIIQDSLKLTQPGPHAFVLLIQLGRITDDVDKMIAMYKIIFGPYFLHHTIIIFTHGEQTPKGEQIVKDFFEDFKISQIGKSLLDGCHQRHMFVNLNEKNEEIMMRKRNTLILKVDNLSENGIRYYADKYDMHKHSLLIYLEKWVHNSRILEPVKPVFIGQEGKVDNQGEETRGQEEDGKQLKNSNLQKERKKQKKERHEAKRYNELKAVLRQEEERRKRKDHLREEEKRKCRDDEERQWFLILLIAVVAVATLSITKIRVRLHCRM